MGVMELLNQKMAAVSNLFESQLDRKLNKHIDKKDKGKSLYYSYDSFNSIAEVSRQLILVFMWYGKKFLGIWLILQLC